MALYQIQSDGEHYWVEAGGFVQAIEVWRQHVKEAEEEAPGEEDWSEFQPDSVHLVDEGIVLRTPALKAPCEFLHRVPCTADGVPFHIDQDVWTRNGEHYIISWYADHSGGLDNSGTVVHGWWVNADGTRAQYDSKLVYENLYSSIAAAHAARDAEGESDA